MDITGFQNLIGTSNGYGPNLSGLSWDYSMPAMPYNRVFSGNNAYNFPAWDSFSYSVPSCARVPIFTIPQFTHLTMPTIPTFGIFGMDSSAATIPQNETIVSKNETPESISTDGIFVKGKGKGTEYGPEFLAKVKQIAKNINCNYRDLLAIMNSESGIDAHVQCKIPGQSATGLIQIIKSSAEAIGTTTAALKSMTAIQQLDYVEKYFKMAKKMAGFAENQALTGGDLYALGFGAGVAKKEVLASTGQREYSLNAGMDLDKDGKITKSDLDRRVKSKYVNDNSFLA